MAHQHGKHLLIGNGYHRQEDERRGIELLMNSRCDACVIHAKALSDEELRGYAAEMPSMVFINRMIRGWKTAVLPWITGAVLSLPHNIC